MVARFIGIITLVFFLGCTQPPTEKEKQMLVTLQKEYSGKYLFEAYDAEYLKVFAVDTINDYDMEKIYRTLVRDNYKTLRWSYLNAYTKGRKFLYQLQYDMVNDKSFKSDTEYH
jgi:hypothetical protein